MFKFVAPPRVRGLKFINALVAADEVIVAPLTGAWIKTTKKYLLSELLFSRTLAGAWRLKRPVKLQFFYYFMNPPASRFL